MADHSGQINEGSWLSPRAWVPRFPPQVWLKTSKEALERAERNILSGIWDKMQHSFIPIHNNSKQLRTVAMNAETNKMPIVLVHGMGSGVGLWVLNYEDLAKNRPVYAFDMPGFGRSSRPQFSNEPDQTEAEFVDCMEEWRKQMELEKFVLLGHSLGGFLAAAYAIQHPNRIRHLILADPWGFPGKPEDQDNKRFHLPWYIKGIAYMIKPFNPLAGLRVVGPLGPRVVSSLRSDLVSKFEHLYRDDTVAQYIYHCNAQHPSGEAAFQSLSEAFGWAKNPMGPRLVGLPDDVPITMIYGSRSWMDSNMGWHIKYKRSNSYVDIHIVNGAGHHVYLSRHFNTVVNRVCNLVDQDFDLYTQSPLGALKRLRRMSESTDTPSRTFGRRTHSECPIESPPNTDFIRTTETMAAALDSYCEESATLASDVAEAQKASPSQEPTDFGLETNEDGG